MAPLYRIGRTVFARRSMFVVGRASRRKRNSEKTAECGQSTSYQVRIHRTTSFTFEALPIPFLGVSHGFFADDPGQTFRRFAEMRFDAATKSR